MGLQPHQAVRLIIDRFADEGAPDGSIGYIIVVFDGGVPFEVAFTGPGGIDYAQLTCRPEDIESAEPVH